MLEIRLQYVMVSFILFMLILLVAMTTLGMVVPGFSQILETLKNIGG